MMCSRGLLLSLMAVGITGCGGAEEPYRKPVSKVIGIVTVDGTAPVTPLLIECYPAGAVDNENPTFSSSETGEGGKFEISTYEKGDGVPPGDYILTFRWQNFNLLSRQYAGPDKLNNRYDDPKKSEHKLTVKEGTATDLGTINLTTK